MLFWLFMVGCNLLMPILFIIAGRMMWKHCPSEINRLIGYRTKRSMKNYDTWQFAHGYCGRLWWIIGWILLLPSAAVLIPFFKSSYTVIGIVGAITVAVQIIISLISIIPTEIALKKTFSDDGTRR